MKPTDPNKRDASVGLHARVTEIAKFFTVDGNWWILKMQLVHKLKARNIGESDAFGDTYRFSDDVSWVKIIERWNLT